MAPFSLTDHLAAAKGDLALPADVLHRQDVIARRATLFVLGWTPKNDCMFVMPLVEAARSKGGALIIPDEHRERPQKGVILAIGSGLWDDEQAQLYPVEAQPGDLVTYGKYSGESFEIGDEATLTVFIMKNVEIKARRLAGTYPALIEHRVAEGTERDHYEYHEAHLLCDHCAVATSPELDAERARLQEKHKADLAGDPVAMS